jgi:type I restriction-modification system DNA methylase subunit
VPPKGNGDMAWIQHMVKSMNSNGRMAVVLPHGALFRKAAEGKIRKALLEQDILEAVIGLGPNIFYGTQLAVCVMVFKQNKDADKKGKVLFIDASDQIRVGRAQNFLEPEHVQQIYDWFQNYNDVENYVKVVTHDDLKENDFNLNIPLYVEKIIQDNLPTVEEATSELKTAWQASLDAEEKFKSSTGEVYFMTVNNELDQKSLEKYLWGAATALRGTIDAGDYKQYIFPLLFFKRISDIYDEEFEKALAESDGDIAYAGFVENHHFQIPEGANWKDVRETTVNVGQALQNAMRAIEQANSDTLNGIFGDANWTNKERPNRCHDN